MIRAALARRRRRRRPTSATSRRTAPARRSAIRSKCSALGARARRRTRPRPPAAGRLGQDQHRPPRGGRRRRRPDQGGAGAAARRDPAAPALHAAESAHRLGSDADRACRRALDAVARPDGAAHRRRQLVRLQRHQRPRRPRGGAGRRAAAAGRAQRPLHVLALSARATAALRDAGRALWRTRSTPSPTDARRRLPHRRRRPRRTSRTGSRSSATRAARRAQRGCARSAPPAERRRPGTGATGRGRRSRSCSPARARSTSGMGRQLYETQPVFRAALDRCDAMLRPHARSAAALPVMFATTETRPARRDGVHAAGAVRARVRAGRAVASWGVEPPSVLGHSVGEYVAACVAGVFSLEDGLRLIAARGRLMQALPADGAMAAVFASRGRGRARRSPARRSERRDRRGQRPGERRDLRRPRRASQAVARRAVEPAGSSRSRCRVSHAFHSPLMEPMLGDSSACRAGRVRRAPQHRR